MKFCRKNSLISVSTVALFCAMTFGVGAAEVGVSLGGNDVGVSIGGGGVGASVGTDSGTTASVSLGGGDGGGLSGNASLGLGGTTANAGLSLGGGSGLGVGVGVTTGTGGGAGGGGGATPGVVQIVNAYNGMSGGQQLQIRKTCLQALGARGQGYDADLVAFCKLLKAMR